MTTVTTTVLKNIQDKELYYVTITQDEEKVNINVGKKTYDAVSKLTKQKNTTEQKEIEAKTKKNDVESKNNKNK